MDELRRDLAGRVPAYMMPALGRPIVDAAYAQRQARPLAGCWSWRREESGRPGPPEGSPDTLEAKVAAIWRSVLQRADIPMDVDFRDLGGDSLSTMNLALEIEQAFGHLPSVIGELAAPPTVGALAQRPTPWLSRPGDAARPRRAAKPRRR